VTVAVLAMNDAEAVEVRAALIEEGAFQQLKMVRE
jgi:hypothetical protein